MALAVTSFFFCYRFTTIFFKHGIFKPGMVLLYWDEVAAKITLADPLLLLFVR
jgi:hypothetical protein